MWEFRKRFCQGLKQALTAETLVLPTGTTTRQWLNRLNKVNRQKWSVFIAKPPEDGGPTPEQILRYQAQDVAGGPLSGDRLVTPPSDLTSTQLAYLRGRPLSETRLVESPEGTVSFRCGAYNPMIGRRDRTEIETVPVAEFLRRYLQHVPPPSYQLVRHYGLYTSAKHHAYAQCCRVLADRQVSTEWEDAVTDSTADRDAWLQEHICPVCGRPLRVSGYLPSSRTGRVIPRWPIGFAVAESVTAGGAHAP
jgi:hypothetical protein